MHSTLTSKGQVTIPADIRKSLGLKPGDQVDFELGKNSTVIVRQRKKYSLDDIFGMLGKPPNPPPKNYKGDFDDLIGQAVSERVMRSFDAAPKPKKRKK